MVETDRCIKIKDPTLLHKIMAEFISFGGASNKIGLHVVKFGKGEVAYISIKNIEILDIDMMIPYPGRCVYFIDIPSSQELEFQQWLKLICT